MRNFHGLCRPDKIAKATGFQLKAGGFGFNKIKSEVSLVVLFVLRILLIFILIVVLLVIVLLIILVVILLIVILVRHKFTSKIYSDMKSDSIINAFIIIIHKITAVFLIIFLI